MTRTGVSRWARIAAFAVPFTVLPSSLWRIAACTFHAPITRGAIDYGNAPSGLPGVPLALYVILLSIASELLAFTAIGLVATWGEVFRAGFRSCADGQCRNSWPPSRPRLARRC